MTCRWCHSPAHSIEHCPEVELAFGPDLELHHCKVCGCYVAAHCKAKHIMCDECRAQAGREHGRRALEKLHARGDIAANASPYTVVRARDFVIGGRLLGFERTPRMGCAEPGMVVRYQQNLFVVCGEPDYPQTLKRVYHYMLPGLRRRAPIHADAQ